MVEYIYQPLEFFVKFNKKVANKICKYCIEKGVDTVIIENIAEELKEKKRKNENGYFTNTISTLRNKYEKNIVDNLKENITKYKQAFESQGLNTLYYTPKVPSSGEMLVRKYGVTLVALLALINGVIFSLYLPFDYLLRKLGKVKIADKLSNILVLPPLKEGLTSRASTLLEDIQKFAEEVEKRNEKKVAVILLNREL